MTASDRKKSHKHDDGNTFLVKSKVRKIMIYLWQGVVVNNGEI